MQKVITIFSQSIFNTGYNEAFKSETEYPELEKYLNDGYKVKQVLSESSEAYRTCITLLLEKA